jgi:hypothetical protein
LPLLTTCFGPRTTEAGLARTTWPTTSQSKSIRTAARLCLTLGAERLWQSSARMKEALVCMRNAVEAYQQAGESYWLPIAQSRVTSMQAELDELKR